MCKSLHFHEAVIQSPSLFLSEVLESKIVGSTCLVCIKFQHSLEKQEIGIWNLNHISSFLEECLKHSGIDYFG